MEGNFELKSNIELDEMLRDCGNIHEKNCVTQIICSMIREEIIKRICRDEWSYEGEIEEGQD